MSRTYETVQRTLSQNVSRLRRERGLSQEGLAFEADVDRTYVSQLERCVNNPSLWVLWKIARALGTDVDALLRNPKA